jgi:peptidoglycan/xylan/chitin deacetylase (PgdA/CDA1 family)
MSGASCSEGWWRSIDDATTMWPVSVVAPPVQITLTFDNLGEAADEELGLPVGALPHASVVQALPWLLSLLDRHSLHGTFFVEAINASRYPDALGSIVDGGHELGCHGWRHEAWHRLDAEAKRYVLKRSVSTLRSCGAQVGGFRPPGGLLEESDFAVFRDEGIGWTSPAGRRAGVYEDVVCLPFEWREIDAYFMADALAPLRQADGLPAEPLPAERFAAAAHTRLDAALASGGGEPFCLVFHPFLYMCQERLEVLAALLDRLRRLRDAGEVLIGPGEATAERLRTQQDVVAPEFDHSGWA